MLKVRKKYKKLLPRNFFRDNPLDDLSGQVIALVSVTMFEDAQYQEHMWKAVEEQITPERLALLEQEKAEISELKTGEAVVKFIRRGFNLINGPVLSQKILTMQDEVVPLLLRRFLTSFQDSIADAAFCALSNSNVNQVYIDQLIADYPKIRNPYAQSMACLVFGMHEREETVPLLLREYERLEEEYPEESYGQGPLLALYLLCGEQ